MTVFSTLQQPSTPTTEQTLQQALEKVLQLAVRHHQSGRIEEAESLYRSILQTQPDHPEANHNLGRLAVQTQQPGTGLPYFAAALEANPGEAEYWISYLNALLQAGETDVAQQVLALGRQHGLQGEDVDVLAGRVEMHAQRAAQSEAAPTSSVEVAGTTTKQNDNTRTKVVPAAKPARQAVSGKGKSIASKQETDTLVMLYKQRRFTEMETLARALTQRFPRHGFGWKALGVVLLEQGRTREALAPAQKGVELLPGDVDAYVNLGVVLQRQGRLAEAQTSYRRALQIKPDYALPYSNLLFCLSHDERVDAAALFAEHVRFGHQFEAPLRAGWPQHRNTREPQRRLQIGVVSADLRNHAVAHFIEPVLAQWASDPGLALHAYYTFPTEDGDTQRLRGYVAHWHAVAGLSDAALAERIRADGIDILLDLSGHTAGNRLPVFARKPAPLQASWIGYAGTTGLQAMDYYLADRHFLPPGRFDSQFTEKIVQLPGGTPFLPAADAPPVNALPALANGHVTFGSFNRPSKLSQPVIALWSQLLRAVPESRMVLGAMPEDGECDALLGWFAQEGIGRERLTLHARCGMRAYLTLHHQVDICLDTFPYNGGTTTLHALWMGVPTLTLAGGTPAGRSGAAVLGHAGLEEFVAQEADGFVAKGVCWAGDLAVLAELRSGLRERYAHSARGQSALVAASVADALRMMWQRWCAGQTPVSFTVALEEDHATRQKWRLAEALAPMQTASELLPDDAEAHNDPGIILADIRRSDAETAFVASNAGQALEQVLQLAFSHHQSGHIEEAESLYRSILQTQPDHPQANHHLGLLVVQAQQPGAGLPYLAAALEADPVESRYWLSYIDALILADEADTARQVLELGRQHGLEGAEVEALAERLKGCVQSVEQPDAASIAVATPPAVSQNGKKSASAKAVPKAKAVRQAASGKGEGIAPSQEEVNTLVALYNGGRFVEMEAMAGSFTQRFPKHGFGWKALGAVLQQQGRIADALAPMQTAVELLPGDAEAHTNLGLVLQHHGRVAEAEASLRRALRLKPDLAAAHFNLGNTLKEQNRLPEAEASFRRALQIKPDYVEAHINLGVIAEDLERLSEAEASYRKALEIRPDDAKAHGHLGTLLKDLVRLPEAEASLRRALVLKPDYAEVHSNLGIVLQSQGRLAEAEASLRRALELKPDYVEAHNNLGIVLKGLGRLTEAEASCRRALELKPDDAEAQCNLAAIFQNQGRTLEAEANLRRALELKPDHAGAHFSLSNALQHLGRLPEAEASYRRSLVLKPDYAEAHNNLGNVLKDQGQLAEAEVSYRRALQIRPDYAYAHSNLLFCMAHEERVDAAALFAEHVRFGDQFEAPLRAGWPQHRNTREPQRCLQVALVSADLRNHAVAHFIEPVLAQWASDPELALHAYYTHPTEDGDSLRLRGYMAHWHAVAGLSDAALAERIRADGIDILLDLSGHTAGNRLLTFARKPAPLQASWLGYPGTTGLQAMDYQLADRYFLPPGQFDAQFTEKIVHLPAGVPFLPIADAPPVNMLPALANGHVTFGSFNRPSKLSLPVIALWAQLLRALPDSRMVLGAMPEDGGYDTLLDWFAREGIARERLSLHARCGLRAYLELHGQVDVCLDTFPYNGGTTTLHALWMGVPTLMLVGRTVPGRAGVAGLSHAGLDAFIAQDAAGFVEKGVLWAGDLGGLAKVRAGLRERFAQSAMGQPALVAAGVKGALRAMWQRWCAGQPAASFEISKQDIGITIQKDNK